VKLGKNRITYRSWNEFYGMDDGMDGT
jgi:hypothetical protein